MLIEIKVPSPGESISEVEMANWFVKTGDFVETDQEIGEIESEKATLPLIADKSGQIEIVVEAGNTVEVGAVVCRIDTSKVGPSTSSGTANQQQVTSNQQQVTSPSTSSGTAIQQQVTSNQQPDSTSAIKATPLAQKIMDDYNLSTEDIINGLKKLSSKDVKAVIQGLSSDNSAPQVKITNASRDEDRTKMSNLRKKLSQRLVAVKNETAMLTTFNEADMSKIMGLRKKYQPVFIEKHGVKLGFMSFFTKAIAKALEEFPSINSRIEGDDIVSPAFFDIGIAVQTDKGLMVPVIRNVETMGLADIEKQIVEFAGKAKKNRISIEDMTGGSFTITNGGTFGSMLSTPIINPPQSAILGMHNIIERPVAVNGEVVIRPMMYLALSYDHRIIDGKDSVGFLVKVKNYIENPERMLFEGMDPEKILLEL